MNTSSEVHSTTPPVGDPASALLAIAQDLTASLSSAARYQRLVAAVRRVIPADAVALLAFEGGLLKPLATEGLLPRASGHRFAPASHPRLAAILASRAPVHFAADDPRPDPYDGLIADARDDLQIHSCMGCSLYGEGELVGLLTMDALLPHAFDAIDDRTVSTLAALAGAAMRTAALFEQLERLAERRGLLARQLTTDALDRRGAGMLGESPAICRVRDEIAVIARSDLTVLITGETGVGKELVARTLHAQSRRADQALVYINCAALPESIAESELFGHTRGSFTGAIADRAGKFELADGGTLFLDEIGELPPALQATLLRALQHGEIQRVGADRHINVDVRVIAATNRNLPEEIRSGRFRADLYHRLSVYPLHVASLRERREDISVLTDHFVDRSRLDLGLGPVRLTPAARSQLLQYDWPGNVRELEHVLMRAVLRAARGRRREPVTVDIHHIDLGAPAPPPPESPPPPLVVDHAAPLRQATEAFQRHYVQQTVGASAGNWAAAARSLGLDRANLHRLARRLGLK